MDHLPEVDTDYSGVFKYILAKVICGNKEKIVLRGYVVCNNHIDIIALLSEELEVLKENGHIDKWTIRVLGGGRIVLDSALSTIKIYGYSQFYGKANHELAAGILKKRYENYDITWSDEGY